MKRPTVTARGIGREGQTLATFDDFAADPDALRTIARTSRFTAAAHHYPGIRAPLPEAYLRDQMPLITDVLRNVFGRYGPVQVLDASFSVVTTPPAALSIAQRLPHCDAFTADRIALVHFLSPDRTDGTAFFRHRSTGFETVTEARRPTYFEQLGDELRAGPAPTGYVAGDTALFEQIEQVEARYNRALIYPSFLLHSGAIAPDAPLAPDAETGRLTVTTFLSVG